MLTIGAYVESHSPMKRLEDNLDGWFRQSGKAEFQVSGLDFRKAPFKTPLRPPDSIQPDRTP
jgi:hypothetical protein